jgi:hypothetical protein
MRLTIVLAALATLAACSGKGTPVQADEALQRDLQLAGSTSLELLPNSSQTAVVSAVEQQGTGNPAPQQPARARAPRPRATRHLAPPARLASAPAPRAPRPAPRTSSQPTFDANVISPPPPGGYKTMGEIMRNSPFPINP